MDQKVKARVYKDCEGWIVISPMIYARYESWSEAFLMAIYWVGFQRRQDKDWEDRC